MLTNKLNTGVTKLKALFDFTVTDYFSPKNGTSKINVA